MIEAEYFDTDNLITKTSQLPVIEEVPINGVDEEPEEVQEYKPRDYRERAFESEICAVYDRLSIQYERQKRCENGIIDIFVYGQPPYIIEVKRSPTVFNVMQAIVQLKCYSFCFRGTLHFIAIPAGIPCSFKPLLKQFGVSEIKISDSPNGKIIQYDLCTRWD